MFYNVGILLPLPGVVVVLGVEDYNYVALDMTPSSTVATNRPLAYYTFTLPTNLIIMMGVATLLPIIWTVHKVCIGLHRNSG